MTAKVRQTAGTKKEGRVIGIVISPELLARAGKLRMAGFVHITGLPVHYGGTVEETLIQARYCDFGYWDSNKGKIVVVTKDGEVWLAAHTADTARIASGNTGIYVPCSNGETIHMSLLLERMADSYSDCGGRYSPIPDPCERN